MSIRPASRALAAAVLAVAVVVAAGCDALPDEQLLRFLGFREPGGTDTISVVTGDLFDNATESVDAALRNATFTVGRNDDPGVGILVHKARVEYSLKGAPSYEFPVTLYLPAPENKGATTEETINGLPIVPEVLKQWIEGSGAQIHPSVRFTASVTFYARTDDGNDLEVEGSVAVELNDGGDSGGGTPGQVTVTVQATKRDPVDTVPGVAGDGEFRVFRAGDQTNAIIVSYQLTGTANRGTSCTTGVDYVVLGDTVSIAGTSGYSTIQVDVCTDTDNAEGPETVILTLSSGSGYSVGPPSSDTVTIRDN
jgi:hypothetical protein